MTNDAKYSTTADFSSQADVVKVRYDDLIAAYRGGSDQNTRAVHDLLERAFSSIGLGIIAITDVPDLSRLRLRLLPLAQKLATLPHDQLEEITVPESDYQVGWVS